MLIRILLRVVLQLHSTLAGNHDFAARSPIGFAVCNPLVIITERTTRSKIMIRQP